MTPAVPKTTDAEALAQIHVQAWAETYAGVLPAAELARFDLTFRRDQWQSVLAQGKTRVLWVPGAGFASGGVQRDGRLADMGYPHELYTLYLLQSAQGRGLGRALMRNVMPPGPFSALVVDGNDRATGFYTRMGARVLERRTDRVGLTPVEEIVFVWDKGLSATFE